MKSLHLSFHLKIITGLLALFFMAGTALALDLEISGELKTGLYMEQMEKDGKTSSYTRIYNNDGDSGNAEGRIRIGLNLTQENFGIRTRFFQTNFIRGTNVSDTAVDRAWVDFAYAYADLLDGQFKISAGLLGESPWASGGPDLFREVENTHGESPIMGIRTEWKPAFLPGLNVGFVLNRDDDTPADAIPQFGDLFLESVVGIAYEHDYFAFRFAYRFDRGLDSPAAIVNGGRFVYRIEERILGTLLPGMQVWANGYCYGLGPELGSGYGQQPAWIDNWFYISYDPDYCSAGLKARYYDVFGKKSNRQTLEFKPYFYWKFFGNFLVAGLMGGIEIGFNDAKAAAYDDFYNNWFIEPQVKINIISNLSAAVVYRYAASPKNNTTGTIDQTHWVNIRLVYSF